MIKPTVDLGAFNLQRASAAEPTAQVALEAVLEQHGAMVQPFLPSLEAEGEVSLVYIAGRFSHAVRKRPADGDFRVQSIWGGTWESVAPTAEHLRVAEMALAGLDADPLYARADLVQGPDREPCLIELELIDPNLFLGEHPPAAAALVEAALLRIDVDA